MQHLFAQMPVDYVCKVSGKSLLLFDRYLICCFTVTRQNILKKIWKCITLFFCEVPALRRVQLSCCASSLADGSAAAVAVPQHPAAAGVSPAHLPAALRVRVASQERRLPHTSNCSALQIQWQPFQEFEGHQQYDKTR